MDLRLEREPTTPDGRTYGRLFVDGVFACHTLEDAIRETKIPGQTAIPAGRYLVRITPSARFKRRLPELVNVPNYRGVRIHPGNTIHDTEGCILPGLQRTATGLAKSRLAFDPLLARLERTPGPHWITICLQESKPTI
jgi:hypothetical protein